MAPEVDPDADLFSIISALPVPAAMVRLVPVPVLRFFNSSFTRTLGYSMEEIPDIETWAHHVLPDPTEREETMARWWAEVDKRRQTGTITPPTEYRITDKWGAARHVLIGFALHGDWLVITFQDITPERKAQAALEAERHRTELTAYALTENMPGGAYTLLRKPGTDRGEFAFFSSKFLEIMDLTLDQALGNPDTVFARVHPDDRQRVLDAHLEAVHHILPFSVEARIVVAGVTRWVRAESVPRTLGDGTTIWEGILVDITSLKDAEARLRSVLEAANAFAWKIDLQAAKTTLDAAWMVRHGYTADDVVQPIDIWLKGVHPDHLPRIQRGLDDLISGALSTATETYMRKVPTGEWVWIRVHAGVSARDDAGKPLEISGVSFDITEEMTERLRAQDAQAELREDLQRAQQRDAVAEIAGSVAHDLNNIIAVISGTTEVLEEHPSDNPTLTNGLERIRKSADLAAALTAELGKLARAIRPRDSHDLRTLLRDGMELLGSARLVRHTVRLTVPDHTLPVWANATDVAQVITALATNACESGAAGQAARVTLAALPAGSAPLDQLPDAGFIPQPGLPVALFTVTDTGTGIAEDLRSRLFRQHVSTKGNQGAGLGLSIVNKILQANGASLWITTEPGAGTVITVAWPCEERSARVSAAPAPIALAHSEPPTQGLLKGLRVLVVDDLQDVAEVLARMLEMDGADSFAESEIAEVKSILSEDPGLWSVLVTDLHMPEMMGDELARFAASLSPPIPTVLVTARPDMVSEQMRAGFAAVLAKPVARSRLAHAVRDATAAAHLLKTAGQLSA